MKWQHRRKAKATKYHHESGRHGENIIMASKSQRKGQWRKRIVIKKTAKWQRRWHERKQSSDIISQSKSVAKMANEENERMSKADERNSLERKVIASPGEKANDENGERRAAWRCVTRRAIAYRRRRKKRKAAGHESQHQAKKCQKKANAISVRRGLGASGSKWRRIMDKLS